MTHMRYWAMTMGVAICGAFIAIERFAFAHGPAVWIAFGVAIGAAVLSLAAFLAALLRENHAFSGLSALATFVAGWTIIELRVFTQATALWIAFVGAIVLLLLSLRALALHETTVERVVHALERAPGKPAAAAMPGAPSTMPAALTVTARVRAVVMTEAMRSWMYWLTQTAVALAGAFVVLMTFAFSVPGHHHASVRWLAFGIGIAATCIAGSALLERALGGGRLGAGDRDGRERLAALSLSGASTAAGIALIVTMCVYSGGTARWVAFALGCALAGASLLASAVHELTSERVRHELEIAEPAGAHAAQPVASASA